MRVSLIKVLKKKREDIFINSTVPPSQKLSRLSTLCTNSASSNYHISLPMESGSSIDMATFILPVSILAKTKNFE
ncbi:hypothetical protein BpHYR1_034702 [Brachionus plicatilis]|uniref:Uncharacterized protein n=1 Tax=Brachionus plicatilis TaxID=10195 RepID=A0A3M7QSU8_BRAPC|nr:hypothetical protein BpHYR1_034702 [Brachionus plicatilis]